MSNTALPDELLTQARAGSIEHLGLLLDSYRQYLKLLARLEIGRKLQPKVDASDLVQDTLLEAHRHFGTFRGESESQLVCWLRQIMAASLANLLRHYLGTKGRDIRLEEELAANLDQSSQLLGCGFVDPGSSPSQRASRREQSVLLADALARLPEDYREVIILRHLEGHPFAEVGDAMGRSTDSVQKLWVRALIQLRGLLGTMK
ncbi:MAG: sigma-70 family RNA polymerase sigma factor [Planctomycetes bacterium]|nr:sigma-70 family RNA polymerase sigma factor [Planctomycetota bacterium]